jgi:hypothetical protein
MSTRAKEMNQEPEKKYTAWAAEKAACDTSGQAKKKG